MTKLLILLLLTAQCIQISLSFRQLFHSKLSYQRYVLSPLFQTTVVPPKVDKTKKKTSKESDEIPFFGFKETKDENFESFNDDEKWMVILYNDPMNKRQYVQSTIMEVFAFTEAVAHETMMRAHVYGFSVCGEWYKELAVEYSQQLVQKGLVAEAKPAGNDNEEK